MILMRKILLGNLKLTSHIHRQTCYFVRSDGPIDQDVENDTSLLYGEIAASPLETIEAMLLSQFGPLFSTSSEWGRTNTQQKSDFGTEMNRFTSNIGAALDTLSCGLELKVSDHNLFLGGESVDTIRIIKRFEKEPDLANNMETLLRDWCESIETYINKPPDGVQVPAKKAKTAKKAKNSGAQYSRDIGPRGELDFWRGRMQRLNSIMEQFQSEHCTHTVEILTKVSTSSSERFGSQFSELLRRWKQIDVTITEAANEAKDNIKYLSSLQRFVGPLYDGTVGTMTDAIPALLNSVKVRRLHLQNVEWVEEFMLSILSYLYSSIPIHWKSIDDSYYSAFLQYDGYVNEALLEDY